MNFFIFYLSLLAISAHAYECNSSCRFNYTKPRGILTSPNYPNSYPNQMTCSYKITLPPGYIVSLSISDTDLGWNYKDLTSIDHLSIFDGDQEIFTRIDVLYGSNYFSPARTYNSTTNQLLLQLKTFSNPGEYGGFHATYRAIDKECGGFMRSDNGTIKYPVMGNDKFDGICDWVIQAPPGHVIRMVWESMDLELSDYLTVREWQNRNFVDIGKYTVNSKPPPLVSAGPIVYIKFTSNDISSFRFNMTYQFVDLSNFPKDKLIGIQVN